MLVIGDPLSRNAILEHNQRAGVVRGTITLNLQTPWRGRAASVAFIRYRQVQARIAL